LASGDVLPGSFGMLLPASFDAVPPPSTAPLSAPAAGASMIVVLEHAANKTVTTMGAMS
jgi:hypothetical protein